MTVEKDPNSTTGGAPKTRFAPKVPAVRIKREDAIQLGSSTAPREHREFKPRPRIVNNTGLLAGEAVQGPFVLGPGTSTRRGAADGTAAIARARKPAAVKKQAAAQHVPSSDTKPVIPLKDYCAGDGKYPETIRAPQGTGTAASLAEIFEGNLVMLRLPTALPLKATPESTPSEKPQATAASKDEETIDLDSLKPSEPTTSAPSNSPYPAPWPAAAHGYLGKIQRFASGRVTLTVGQIEYALSLSSPSRACVQNLLAVDSEYNQAFDIGTISHQLVAVPDIEGLLAVLSVDQ